MALRLFFSSVFWAILVCCISGCSKSSSGTSDFTGALTAIENSISVAGSSMQTGTLLKSRIAPSDCDQYGYPTVNQSNENYPGHLTYCFLTVDSGDTVRGGFSTPAALSCVLSKLSVNFDGSTQSFTVTPAIAAECGLNNDRFKNREDISGTLTASAPAAFNTNYAQGIVLDVTSLGLVFKIAIDSDGNVKSFITNENWTDGSIGATAGTLDTSTGDLWYEARVERNDCSVTGRCGWNRHTRIRANMVMSGATPTDLNTIQFAYSNIQFLPGQDSLGGTLITAKGALSTGIKARLWNWDSMTGSPTAADYSDTARWQETTNTKCYSASSESAAGCDAGMNKPSAGNTKFFLNATTDSHASVPTWFAGITGQTFSSIDIEADSQF